MASLAHILLDEGYEIRGCDTTNFINSEVELLKRNVIIDDLNTKEYLNSDIIIIGHFFVNKELIDELNKYEKVFFEYHDFLSRYIDKEKMISICGSHSKTTLVKLLSSVNDCSSYLIGEGVGKKRENDLFFFLESCEYQNHFLKYNPKEIIITNIDYDHVDFFKSEEEYVLSFQNFVNKCEKVYCLYEEAMKIKHQNIITYGLNKKANYHIEIEKVIDDKYLLSFYKKDEKIIEFETIKRTNHFLELTSILLTFYYEHNFDLKIIVNKIDEFTFPSQRFIVEEYKNNYLINDYCHHPSQIKYNLEQINFYYKNITKIAIFKPDRTSRLVYFKDRFIEELEKYDLAFVLDLANTEEVGIHSSIELCTNKIIYLNSAQDIEKYLSKNENYAISFMSSKNLNREINQIKNIIDKIKI